MEQDVSTQSTSAAEGPRATPGAMASDEGDRFEATQRTERVREGLEGDKARLEAAQKAGSSNVEELQKRVDEAQLNLDAAEAFEDAISGTQ